MKYLKWLLPVLFIIGCTDTKETKTGIDTVRQQTEINKAKLEALRLNKDIDRLTGKR